MRDICEWDVKIDTVLSAYHVSKHHCQPRLPLDVEFLPNHNLEDDNVEEFLSTMLKIKDEIKNKASVNITKAQRASKRSILTDDILLKYVACQLFYIGSDDIIPF